MAEETHVVKTTYTVDTKDAEASTRRLGGSLKSTASAIAGMSGDLRSKAVPAFGGLSASATAASSVLVKMPSLFKPLIAAAGAFLSVLGTKKLIDIGDGFEKLQNSMAQTLTFMGQGGTSYADALHNANVVISEINATAAVLPGEASDYANVLALAGTSINRATGDFRETLDLVKQTTAVGISMGANAEETAKYMRDALFAERGMLSSSSTLAVRTLNAMRELPGHADLTLQKFNEMALEERAQLLDQMGGAFSGMIEQAGNSWDAASGALSAAVREVTRLSTEGLFKGIVSSTNALTDMLISSDGEMTSFAQTIIGVGNAISTVVGNTLVRTVGLIGTVTERVQGMLFALGDTTAFRMIHSFLTGGGFGGVLSLFGAAGDTLFSAIERNFHQVGNVLAALIPPVMSLANVLGGVFMAVLDTAIGVFEHMLGPVVFIAQALFSLITVISDYLGPTITSLLGSLGGLVTSIASVVGPTLQFLGGAIYVIARGFLSVLMPPIKMVGWVLGKLIDTVSWVIGQLGRLTRWLVKSTDDALAPSPPKETTPPPGEEGMNPIEAFFAKMAGGVEGLREGGAKSRGGEEPSPQTPAARGGSKTVQDFRFSRFDIAQTFDERFTPDQIAAAFARDLGDIAEQRLQSGFEPAYGLR